VNRLKTILLVSFLTISFGSWGQMDIDTTEEPIEGYQNVFKDGEWFQFRIHYGFFNASYVTLSLEADTINEVPVFHAKGYGTTTGLARLLYKVEDYYDSYFSQENGLPLWFIRNINEGGYTKDLEIHFDHEKEIAKINDKKKKKRQEIKINPNAHDLISAFYHLRNTKNTSAMKVGESVEINMFFDAENYLFKLNFWVLKRSTLSLEKYAAANIYPMFKAAVFLKNKKV